MEIEYIKRIEKELKKNKITAKKMLLELGYSDSIISGWKKGSEPSAIKLLKICNYLNVSIEYILTGKTTIENNLSKEQKELIEYFKKLTEKEQMKELARLELLAEQREEKENATNNTKLSV